MKPSLILSGTPNDRLKRSSRSGDRRGVGWQETDRTMLVVGLTGGVASGKTAVSQVLREEGATILDADLIARELVEPHQPAWEELRRAFGDEILNPDGSVQRKKLAAQIFSHPEKREVLNAILHPRIRNEIQSRLRGIRERDPGAIVVVDAALLVESGDYQGMDGVIVVSASETQQVDRLREREGLSEDAARQILASQTSAEERLKVADFVIRNEGSLEDTRRRAREVFQALKKMALAKENLKGRKKVGAGEFNPRGQNVRKKRGGTIEG